MSIHNRWPIVLALTCSMLPREALAQSVAIGTRVRVVDAALNRPLATGTLIRTAGDTVIILPDGGAPPRALLIGTQRYLEVSTGTHRRKKAGQGVRIGMVVGAAAGALVGLALYQEPDCRDWICFDFGPGMNALGGAVLGIIPGAVVGGVVGATSTYETWRRE